MKNILFNRLIQLLTVVWGVGTLTFVLMRSLPGDMAYRIAAGRFGYDNVTASAAEMVRAELGLDLPPFHAYLNWLLDLLTLNLGNSMVSGAPVIQEVSHQLGHSILLGVSGVALSMLVAIPLGLAAARYGGWIDRLSLLLSTLVRSLPVFVVGLVMVLMFALNLSWFPVAGFGEGKFLVLPAVSLALVLAATSNRIVCDSAKQVMSAPFYQFSQVKGLSEKDTFIRNGIRNISVPVLAFMGIQLITVIEGIVMIESLFSWPGIGHGLAHAIFARDIPIIQGAALCMGVLFVGLNTVIDIACIKIDPRSTQESPNQTMGGA